MGIGERVGDAGRDSDGRGDAELLLAFQASPECLALDEWHDIVQEAPTGFTAVEQRQQLGMLQLRRDLDLAQEPLGAERRAELRLEDLERNFAVVLQFVGEIDGRHPAFAEHALNAVPVGQGAGERRVMVCAGGCDVVGHMDHETGDRLAGVCLVIVPFTGQSTAECTTRPPRLRASR